MTESRSPLFRAAVALIVAGWLLGATTVLSGCGGTTRTSSDGTLSVALREYRITPQKAHVGSGALTVSIANDGRLTHSLVILDATGAQVAASQPLAPGQTGSLVTSLPAGRYVMTSGIQGDKADGLYGTLDVG